MAKKKYYVVARGAQPGIYAEWAGAKAQVEGYPGAVYKGFADLREAIAWFEAQMGGARPKFFGLEAPPSLASEPVQPRQAADLASGRVVIFTDGGSLGNPGPGGYGVVLLVKKGDRVQRKELSGGYRQTTNNRMELMACIVALGEVKKPSPVTVFSDSRYVVEAINQGWAPRWRANRWMRGRKPVENADLWKALLALVDQHEARFVWVEGHAGSPENERCDQLARAAAGRADLPPDAGYESDQNRQERLF